MNNEYLKKYVRLAVRTGTALRPGQTLVISSPVECADFARMAADEAYAAGAREVVLNWKDDGLSRSKFLNAHDSVFDEYPAWTKLFFNSLSAAGAAFLHIVADDPEALKGVEFSRIMRAEKASDRNLKPYRKRIMGNEVQWCLVSVPTVAWAKKVFPDTEDAVERLWDAIFAAARVDDNDPVENWLGHISGIKKNLEILNGYNLKSLRFTNGLGTDLTVGLPQGHVWLGGGDVCKEHRFFPNIPTEEVFTAPARDGVNGRVVSSKPAVYGGNVIEDFSLTFKNGKVVEFDARKNRGLLAELFSTIKNMDYLGEVALVPHDSPISSSGVLFYNTLYDENASCHLALGQAYPACLRGAEDMTRAMRQRAGLNQCDAHHDFMIGTGDMRITGETLGGDTVDLFIDGNFAF